MDEEEYVVDEEYDVTPNKVIITVQQHRMNLLKGSANYDEDELTLLKDLSKTAVDQIKLETGSASITAQKEIAGMLAKAISSTVVDPFAIGKGNNKPIPELPEFELVEGEADLKIDTLTFDEVMKEE